ncbi:IreB family regulatory phosphoprotein [Streptococcus loxodontisalivarius]|uniref:Uncharacterized protein (UPF0297 family) n=1 Tax=Streptococcus loxodontisalivarius TaxID=1349415 RepID=A0ABS2PPJ7_9STRE|nr:IreB family regulatory phosphoprotein [Streptococcus loxodontisalivarius]MBM7641958.1 uncharacterized protein (UPF0297 family) [Streptococcus loxodontisalivarius]
MTSDKTMVYFNSDKQDLKEDLTLVWDAIDELGYNSVNQLIGYLLSGDLTFIPHHKNARQVLKDYQPDDILEVLVKNYLQKGDHQWENIN